MHRLLNLEKGGKKNKNDNILGAAEIVEESARKSAEAERELFSVFISNF